MARKTLQGLSGIADTIARSSPNTKDRSATTQAPALGALQGSLSAIREIDPSLVDDWGPMDRLDEFTAVNSEDDSDGFEMLKNSIKDGGQQVPILVRRSSVPERYEAIYGRRRLKACKELGIKVRANVQDIDDATALLAKGLENAARRNLSFYEKCRFAVAIKEAGHDSKTIRQVLSLTAPGLSHLTKISDYVPAEVGNQIGAAPKSGRPKWTALAEAFKHGKITRIAATKFLTEVSQETTSDERLEMLLKEIGRRGARPQEGREVSPVDGVTIKTNRTSLSLSLKKAGKNAEFARWMEDHLEDIIRESYAEFTAVNSENET